MNYRDVCWVKGHLVAGYAICFGLLLTVIDCCWCATWKILINKFSICNRLTGHIEWCCQLRMRWANRLHLHLLQTPTPRPTASAAFEITFQLITWRIFLDCASRQSLNLHKCAWCGYFSADSGGWRGDWPGEWARPANELKRSQALIKLDKDPARTCQLTKPASQQHSTPRPINWAPTSTQPPSGNSCCVTAGTTQSCFVLF